MTARITRNRHISSDFETPADPGLIDFHTRMPAYSPTALFDVPQLAERFGVGHVLVKAETNRMGLPSFKILGASWATYRAICDRLGTEPEPWHNIAELAERLAPLGPLTLASATDGNHGRALAYMARLLGLDCVIFVPRGMAAARIEAIEREGARVVVVDGTYDDAVAKSAAEASASCLVVSDTSWPGYTATPERVIEGYSTIFNEVDDAMAAAGLSRPDAVVVPMGVGAFMAAAVRHYRSGPHRTDAGPTTLIGVEPISANCIQASVEADELVHVPGPHPSIMVGLNCGFPSAVAWTHILGGVEWFVGIDDEAAEAAMRDLASAGIVAGETGAASLAGLEALLDDEAASSALGLRSDATVVVIVTEGATDPVGYERVVGRRPEAVGELPIVFTDGAAARTRIVR